MTDVLRINTPDDIDALLGKGAEFGEWCKSALRKAERTPVFFTAGTCSRCGASCVSQRVRIDMNGKHDALCPECVSRECEATAPDWFAAEERATR